MSVVEGERGRGQGCYATAANDPSSDIAVACMVEMLAPADATRSLSCRVIEYPSQWRFGARSAYSLWWTIDSGIQSSKVYPSGSLIRLAIILDEGGCQ
jgi:hypothetical protein